MRSRIELVAVRVGNGGDHLSAHPLEGAVGQQVERQRGEDQESGGHAARSRMISFSATSSANSLSAEGRVMPRFQRDGVVASTLARSQTRDIGMPLDFACANNRSRGCVVSMFMHGIGRSA